jgi:acyl carrier protein
MNEVAVRQTLLDALNKVIELDPQWADQLLDPESDRPLAEFRMDSLDAVDLCMEIETTMDIELNPADLAAAGSFAGLASLIADRLGKT